MFFVKKTRLSSNTLRPRVTLQIGRSTADRLRAYLQVQHTFGTKATNHWENYRDLNRIRVDPESSSAYFSAGAGFDSEYELNFRKKYVKEYFSDTYRALFGKHDALRFKEAFLKLWGSTPQINLEDTTQWLGMPLSAHKILAAHYANLVLPHLPAKSGFCYLEIGAGAGYLAAIMHRLRGGKAIIVDLPEILPFSFLFLHSRFPDSQYLLPHEASEESISGNSASFVFLTATQMNLVRDQFVDLAVNTASFGEMMPEQILAYFKFLRRALKSDGLFFNVNRVEKWMSQGQIATSENVPGKGIAIRFREYPWSARDRDLFFRLSEFHAIVQPQNSVFSRLCRLAREQ